MATRRLLFFPASSWRFRARPLFWFPCVVLAPGSQWSQVVEGVLGESLTASVSPLDLSFTSRWWRRQQPALSRMWRLGGALGLSSAFLVWFLIPSPLQSV
ncbi:hypothetical protein F2Q69_00009688 [Brassica cretica]|uniref:Uncharacterized protein n=1 Tax=Brassica cretica TaxID=69181 RepID=A0A8S9P2Y1_BRACR|nr:hypothetical protein F2Q69_00009688 [Brassica cretica]